MKIIPAKYTLCLRESNHNQVVCNAVLEEMGLTALSRETDYFLPKLIFGQENNERLIVFLGIMLFQF